MKILHVIAWMDPEMGGVCQAVRTIIAGLQDLKVHNEVVSLDDPGKFFIKNDAFLLHALGTGKGPWSYNSRLLPWLITNLARFDIVLVHGLWLYPSYAIRKARQILRAKQRREIAPKLFVMPHGMLDPYFQKAPGRKLKAIRNYIYWKLMESKLINQADGMLFTCEEESYLARAPFQPYRPRRELIVGLGVEEPPVLTPAMSEAFLARCPALGKSSYLLFLSRIHEKKGVDLLIKAYAKVVAKALANKAEFSTAGRTLEMPAIPKLVIAGPGLDTKYGREMQQLVSTFKELQNLVFFPGMLTGEAKWGAFYHCEAFVLPSHQENFGIAVVEAMACGKPVLISNQINIWREIEATGGGLVAADTLPGTQQLLESWCQLASEEKRVLGVNARASFKNNFAVKPVARRLLEKISQE